MVKLLEIDQDRQTSHAESIRQLGTKLQRTYRLLRAERQPDWRNGKNNVDSEQRMEHEHGQNQRASSSKDDVGSTKLKENV